MKGRIVTAAACLAATLLCACASQKPEQMSGSPEGASIEKVCKERFKPGSHIGVTRCQARAEAKAEEKASAEDLRRNRSPANARSTGKFNP